MKVYKVRVIQKSVIEVRVAATSKKEAIDITENEDCEWSLEKEKNIGQSKKSAAVAQKQEYHKTNYAYFRDYKGRVKCDRIENLIK